MRKDRIRIDGDTAIIATKHGDMLMDAADVGLLDGCGLGLRGVPNRGGVAWYARVETYKKPRRRQNLARIIMLAPEDMEVDHINHNTLDNRRCNLRVCTVSENRRNGRKQAQSKGRYKGVVYHAHGTHNGQRSGGVVKRWRAYTRVLGKRIWLGYYATEDDAARAYNDYARKAFGEYACLNPVQFIPDTGAI